MKQNTVIKLQKEAMHFSAGHFTIFSATERENFHGHNYHVAVYLSTTPDPNGLSFDYCFYKREIIRLCQQLDETFLMPGKSPYLTWEERDGYLWFSFHDQKLPFLPSDVTILPISNITVEALSHYLLETFLVNKKQLEAHHIHRVVIEVFSGMGQSGSACWGTLFD